MQDRNLHWQADSLPPSHGEAPCNGVLLPWCVPWSRRVATRCLWGHWEEGMTTLICSSVDLNRSTCISKLRIQAGELITIVQFPFSLWKHLLAFFFLVKRKKTLLPWKFFFQHKRSLDYQGWGIFGNDYRKHFSKCDPSIPLHQNYMQNVYNADSLVRVP